MAFSDTADAVGAFIRETVYGTIDATPVWLLHRIVSESLQLDSTRDESEEITGRAAETALSQRSSRVNGSIVMPLTFGAEVNSFLEWLVRGSFSTNDLKAAQEQHSIAWERRVDVAGTLSYFRYTGLRPNSFTLDIPENGGDIRLSAECLGLAEATDTAIVTGATDSAANTNPIMTSAILGAHTLGGGLSDQPTILSGRIQIGNNLREQHGWGAQVPQGIGYGKQPIEVSLQLYFDALEEYLLFPNNTSSSLSVVLSDGTNSYTFLIPKMEFTAGAVPIPGNNQDVIVNLTGRGLYDTGGEATNLKITKSS